MSDTVFDALLNQLADFAERIKFVQFGVHGEPLLDKGLEARIGKLNKIGVPKVWVATNGAAMTKERAERFLAAGTEAVIFSVDGITRETYEKVRIGLQYDRVVENVLNFIAARDAQAAMTRVVLRFVSQNLNKHEYVDWASFWSSKLRPHHDGLHHVQMHNWAFAIPGVDGFGNTPCPDVMEGVLVSADGSVPLCCLDYEGEYSFGNVLHAHIVDIFNSRLRSEVRQMHAEGKRSALRKCDKCYLPEYNMDPQGPNRYYDEFERKLYWNEAGPD